MTKISKQPTFGKESETLEFKESLSGWKEIIETISAFSNTKGGTILIGINDSGKIKGVDIGKSTLEDLANKIKENTDPKIYPHINTKVIDGKSIIIIDVKESSDHLILALGRPLKRMGKSTMRMSKDSQRFFPQVKIRAGRLKGSEGLDFIDMKLLEGTIPELREKAITKQIYCQINSIGDTYAKKELKELIQKKIVRRIGKGRSTCYALVSD